MKYTSAQLGKVLKQLQEEYDQIRYNEEKSKEFLLSVGETADDVRPEYDFLKVQETLDALEENIRKFKHALNIFNVNTVIPEFNMTVDSMLVYIPQLTKRKAKLLSMSNKLPKQRESDSYGRQSAVIDYRYTNYDVKIAKAEFVKTSELLAKAQTALDAVNAVESIDIDL